MLFRSPDDKSVGADLSNSMPSSAAVDERLPAASSKQTSKHFGPSLAAAAPALEMRVEGREIVLDHRNLVAATVALHEMDLEVLFSRNPFAGSFAGQFGSVRTNRTLEVDLDASGTTRVPLPPEAAR